MTDNVNHPAHYTAGGIECIDALAAATEGLRGIEAVCTANAIKYLWRWKRKNGVEDLQKARWYIDRLIKTLDKPADEHDGCERCRYDDLEENDEPCASCKGTANTLEENRARRDYFERCEEEGK
nr:MAG TPA: nucelotide kinase [Caudoviricetes sp.]